MTCEQAVDTLTGRIESWIGSNLPNALERHLAECPECAGHLERTESVRRLLRECCERRLAPSALRVRISRALPHRAA